MDHLGHVEWRSILNEPTHTRRDASGFGAALAAGGVRALFARDRGGSIRRRRAQGPQGDVERARGAERRAREGEELGFANADERGGLGRVGR